MFPRVEISGGSLLLGVFKEAKKQEHRRDCSECYYRFSP